jgi:pyruvate formate lyase activating enzyme
MIRQLQKCIGCYSCYEQCPRGAIKKGKEGPEVDLNLCCSCFSCTEICPSGAVEKAGKTINADELVAELLKDRLVFEESGGGVTFSGGEPFMQPKFLLKMLQLLQREDIHTTIETCGYTAWTNMKQAAALTGLFLYDLKLIDDDKYRQYTGISGKLILSNLKKLTALDVDIQVRMPVIKGINDDKESLEKAAAFLLEVGIKNIELIPYHNFGEAKHEKIGRVYRLKGMPKYSDADLQVVSKILNQAGIMTNSEGGLNDYGRTGNNSKGKTA